MVLHRLGRRLLPAGLAGVLTCFLFLPAAADADDYTERRKPGRCHCHRGEASWDYLRSPLVPPEDPPHCGLIIAHGSCRDRPRPKGLGALCWGSQKEECFFKRHAYSWKIRCSECWNDLECPPCDPLIGGPDSPTRLLLAKRIRAEKRTLPGKIVVAVSPHFYVVTQAEKRIKLTTRRGTKRIMTAHEIVHLYAQRAELAYQDFEHWFGGEILLQKPMAIYVVDSEKTRKAIGARYFGGEGIHMNYAFAYNDRVAQGFSGNGFVVGLQHERNDTRMHGFLRHQIGHILFSCWVVQGGFEEECPRWAWVGAAHFLQKLHDLHKNYATYCYGEGGVGEGPQTRWPRRVRKMASARMDPIESFFNRTSLASMRYADHLRAWSIMDLMLREDRARWLKLLARLRVREHEGKAFKAELGITPDQFHKRWVERVLGKRKTMGELRADGRESEEPGRRERTRLQETDDPDELAGLIRGLDVITDLKTLEAVLPRLTHPSDLVRESLHLVLLRTKDPALLAFLREQALYDQRALVRAGVIRLLGALKDADARERIQILLKDSHWLVRANAAQALARIADPASRPALEAALDDRKPKPWIAAADAFASFPGRSKAATLKIAPRLSHARWQVRLTATRALAQVGTEEGIDALIERFSKEGGRLKKELRAALRAVTGDDLGPRPATWKRWWAQQKKKHGGLPPTPPEPVKRNPADERYADPGRTKRPGEPEDPHYYGRRIFSRSVCFVLDTSESMKLNMKVRPEQIKELGDLPAVGTRDEIAKKALLDALKNFDPRTRLRIVFFNTHVRLWKRDLVPASPTNVEAVISALRNTFPAGQTNFHGALKAALGLHERPSLDPRLEDIPDTVFFLTDGRPTKGEITAMPELISWFEDLNRFAKVNLHVIALGDLNIDTPSLEALAVAGKGEFIHVRER